MILDALQLSFSSFHLLRSLSLSLAPCLLPTLLDLASCSCSALHLWSGTGPLMLRAFECLPRAFWL